MITPKKVQGFTLIEVMVAMAVIAVALPALMSVIMNQIDNAGYIRERSMAEWVAENLVEEYRINLKLSGTKLNGKATGSTEFAGEDWQWQMQMQPTLNDSIKALEVRVSRDTESLDNNPMSLVRSFFYEKN